MVGNELYVGSSRQHIELRRILIGLRLAHKVLRYVAVQKLSLSVVSGAVALGISSDSFGIKLILLRVMTCQGTFRVE